MSPDETARQFVLRTRDLAPSLVIGELADLLRETLERAACFLEEAENFHGADDVRLMKMDPGNRLSE